MVDNTSYWRMHDDVPLVVAERQRRRGRGPQRHRRQPQLHDDADDGGAEADPRRRRASSAWSSPPTSRSRAPAARRSRSCASSRGRCSTARTPRPRSSRTRSPSTSCPRSRSSLDGDDYTTEERKVMARDPQDPRLSEEVGISATCVRVPVVTGHSESVNVQTERTSRPRTAASCSRRRPAWSSLDDPGDGVYPTADRRPRAATRSSSAASAATPRTSAASTSGSSATTCARAPPPTPSRSPSCWSSATWSGCRSAQASP